MQSLYISFSTPHIPHHARTRYLFLSILIIIYKDNNKDDTTGSNLIIIYPVAITQRGASERYVPSQGWVREQGKRAKLGKTMIGENLHTLVQGEIVGKSKDTRYSTQGNMIYRWNNATSLASHLDDIMMRMQTKKEDNTLGRPIA